MAVVNGIRKGMDNECNNFMPLTKVNHSNFVPFWPELFCCSIIFQILKKNPPELS